MPRRISPSQFRSKVRQAQSKLRQAAQKQKQAVDRLNRDIRSYNQKQRRAVDDYNRKARTHNGRVRSNRRRLEQELAKLRSASNRPTRGRIVVSAERVHTAFTRVEEREQAGVRYPEALLALFENETANSLHAANVFDGGEAAADAELAALQQTSIAGELRVFSPDLDQRWRGALFALNPQNPDAARHFCTSARECVVVALDVAAPDEVVKQELPNYDTTDDGRVTRRSKLRYLLRRQGVDDAAAEDFMNEDVDDILELFRVFNDGTHGSAGRFNLHELVAVKRRVESGIQFLHQLAGAA